MELTKLFKEFIDSGKAGGIILLIATATSLLLANSSIRIPYVDFWSIDIGGHTIVQWINDGLMTIFFLLIGLELEREFYQGELSTLKSALLPIFAAVGGMLTPAALFLVFNYGGETQRGAGIPMATDIAFAVGILSLLGSRVPASLKVFLTALAVMDDLGAIIVIAIFYTASVNITNLLIALAVMGGLFILNRMKVHNLIPYLIGGGFMWYFLLSSGVHATIAGVLLAFVIPFSDGGERSPSYVLQHVLHLPVAFVVLPLFALANTCISVGDNWQRTLIEPHSLGIFAGLIIGKPFGIVAFCLLSVGLRITSLPEDLKWSNILGAGFLAGIGFTMSIFITMLAFHGTDFVNSSKLSVLIASFIAGIIGYVILRIAFSRLRSPENVSMK